MLESKIQAQVTKYLKSIGCKVIKIVTASVAGHADLVICYKGLYVEFEMKQPGKHAKPLQIAKGKETMLADGFWFVIHSLEEAKAAIAEIELGIED